MFRRSQSLDKLEVKQYGYLFFIMSFIVWFVLKQFSTSSKYDLNIKLQHNCERKKYNVQENIKHYGRTWRKIVLSKLKGILESLNDFANEFKSSSTKLVRVLRHDLKDWFYCFPTHFYINTSDTTLWNERTSGLISRMFHYTSNILGSLSSVSNNNLRT